MSPLRLAGIAAAFTVAMVGAAWFGRMTASSGVGGTPTESARPSAVASAEITIKDFRAARNEICARYAAELNPLKPQLDGIYDAATSATDRAAMISTLRRIADRADAMIGELQTVPVPGAVVADQTANISRLQDTTSLIRQELTRLAAGELAEAQALDLATDPLSRQVEAFENKYGLAACP